MWHIKRPEWIFSKTSEDAMLAYFRRGFLKNHYLPGLLLNHQFRKSAGADYGKL